MTPAEALALRVRSVIAEHAVQPLDVVTDDRRLGELDLDSLDRQEIVGALETEHGFIIPDRMSGGWQTVGDVVRTVDALVNDRGEIGTVEATARPAPFGRVFP